jgi:hypothetical protein
MSVHGPISSDIAAQANVGVQGNNGSRRRKRQTTLVTQSGASPPLIDALRKVHSITSSAIESTPNGMVSPSALAAALMLVATS